MFWLRAPSISLVASVAALSATWSPFAWAQESAYCRKVKARASADAALLVAPRVVAQAIRYPTGAPVDTATPAVTRRDVELRAGISVSPVDTLRGLALLRVADAECEEHEAAEGIERALRRDTSGAELEARRSEALFLAAHRTEWLSLLEKGQNRLKAGIVTVMELHELQRLVDLLERRVVEVEAEVARLDTKSREDAVKRRAPSLRRYLERARAFEREASSLRAYDAWNFRVTGGVVPNTERQGRALDWFGFAELGYSFGGVWQTRAESRYLAARNEELSRNPEELSGKLQLFRRLLETLLASSQRELAAVEGELDRIRKTLHSLEGFDAPEAVQGRARLVLEGIAVEADTVFLRAQAQALSLLVEQTHDS